MEGSRRSSTALLLLLLLVLMLVPSSATAAAARQRRQPPTADGSYYKLITVTGRGSQGRLAMRVVDSSIVGFSNGKNGWFAVQGTEDLMEPLRKRYGGDIPGRGLVNLLGALVK